MKHIIGCLFACIGMIWCAASARAGIDVEHARVRMSPTVADISMQSMNRRGADLNAPVRDTRSAREPAQQLFEKAMDLVGKRDLAGASVLFQQAAEKGNRRAQYQLGLLYARGDGVRKNLIRARELLHKAAMQGHPKAQFYLGQMYLFGDGGEKDNIKATMWFWIATTLGDRFAKDSLRVMSSKISPRELTIAKKRARALWLEIPHDMKIEHGATMR